MANLIGLLVGAAVLLLTVNVVPGLQIAALWQISLVVALVGVNLTVWKMKDIPKMSFLDAVRTASLALGILFLIALVDVGIGYLGGERDVMNAFLHSGAAGGILDCFLAVVALLVGLPTLVRSVISYHD